jgi:lysyl-tRNA synthetase class I
MKSQGQKEQDEKQLQDKFGAMYEELYEWRENHPEVSFDEIVAQVTPRRQELMGELLAHLALQHGSGAVVEGLVCEKCGRVMEYKGEPKRDIECLEGETKLYRAYFYCPHCEGGVFPPGPPVAVG